jgi:hypothetical protein
MKVFIRHSYSRWTDRSLHLCFKTVRATFAAHGSSVRCPLSRVSVRLSKAAGQTCDLMFRASPLRGIAPARRSVGSSACKALLPPITCTAPSSRQHIRGVTLGLGCLRNPSPSALRLAPAPGLAPARTDGGTPCPVLMTRIRRAVRSTGCMWQCIPVRFPTAGAVSCAFWLQRIRLFRWVVLPMAHHTFADAAHRCLRDGIPGVRLPGSVVYPRFNPLRTSRRVGGYAVTSAPEGVGIELRRAHPKGHVSSGPPTIRYGRMSRGAF